VSGSAVQLPSQPIGLVLLATALFEVVEVQFHLPLAGRIAADLVLVPTGGLHLAIEVCGHQRGQRIDVQAFHFQLDTQPARFAFLRVR
jgi:hypothetical protein